MYTININAQAETENQIDALIQSMKNLKINFEYKTAEKTDNEIDKNDAGYSQEFVAKIEQGLKEIKDGKTSKLDLETLWK